MKVENLDCFKKEVHANLKRMNIDDVSTTCELICEMAVVLDKENIEKAMMEELYVVLGENTNEMVEVVCSHLGVRRHYDSDINVEKEELESNDSPGVLSGRLGYKLSTLGMRHGIKMKKTRSKIMKDKKLKWSDLARSTQDRGRKRLNLPCADLMGSGVCMNVDTCRFSHKNGAVVKSKVTKFTSSYNTPKEKVDYRSCILPEQSGYYDNMTVLPGARHDDTISISSTENDLHIDLRSPPCIYEPPTMLDSPLWYKEMGLVEEISDSNSSCSHRRRRVYRHRSLLLSNIPQQLNRIGVINKYFRKFGALRNIEVNFKGNSTEALVEFRLSKDMMTANKCVEAVLGNRFITTRPYKKKKRKGKSRNRSRRRSRSLLYKCRVNRSRSRRRSHSWSRRRHASRSSCNSRCNDYGPKSENIRIASTQSEVHNSTQNRSSSEASDHYNKNRRVYCSVESEESVESVHVDGQTDSTDNIPHVEHDGSRTMKSVVINCKREVLMEVDSQERNNFVFSEEILKSENAHESPSIETNKCNESLAGRQEIGMLPSLTQEVITAMSQSAEDEDVKLENALNDSDVDSVHSDDSFSRTKRQMVMSNRRKKLQEDNLRNSAKKKISRNAESLNYYKSILETLIIEYRRNDKPGKARIIPKIKEAHAKYMEIKALHAALIKSMEAHNAKNMDAIEGQINNLGSSIEVKLTVASPQTSCNVYIEVPCNIVLDPVQIQGHLGVDLKIENMEKLQTRSSGTCYVITLQSPSKAATALQFLATNNPMNWHMEMTPPQSLS